MAPPCGPDAHGDMALAWTSNRDGSGLGTLSANGTMPRGTRWRMSSWSTRRRLATSRAPVWRRTREGNFVVVWWETVPETQWHLRPAVWFLGRYRHLPHQPRAGQVRSGVDFGNYDPEPVTCSLVDVCRPDPRTQQFFVDVVLSKPIDLSTFTFEDLTFTRNGTPVVLSKRGGGHQVTCRTRPTASAV